jgi:hypothetical protein
VQQTAGRIVVHVFGEMGNIHALNPFPAAAGSSSGSVMSQPAEVRTKESAETITTTGGSLSPQSSIDNDAVTPRASSFMELHISPNSLIDFHEAELAIGNDRILSENFVHNHV